MATPKKPEHNYMDKLVTSSRAAFVEALQNPELWSEKIIQQTLSRRGGTPFDIEDAQAIVKDYLTVLAENVRKGKAAR